MRLCSLLVATLTALSFSPANAVAQSPLTTVFNGVAGGKTVYFDLNVLVPAITITRIDLKIVGTGTVQIYERAGTRVGHVTNPAGWTLVAQGAASNPQLPAAATTVHLSPFQLSAGVHGIAVHVADQSPSVQVMQYAAGGTGLSMTASTAEVSLQAGELGNALFGPVVPTPFIVNARIHYLVGSQVAIPPHGSTYNLLSRGYNFTAATDFVIRQLGLPPEAKQAGDTASYLVRKNGAVAFRSIGNTGAVHANVSVNVGDVIDVIGNWSPVNAGYSTAHNSYAAGSSPYATTIEGVAHTLNRAGWQWDIGDPAWTPSGATGTALTPSNGLVGRIQMTTSPLVSANSTVLGQGCGQQFASIYEMLSPANFDLANKAITLHPGSHGYTVDLVGSMLPVGSVGTPVTLPLLDDDLTNVLFTTGSFPGWNGFQVSSNGYISALPGLLTANPMPNVSILLNSPRDTFWAWHDYNPASPGSGQIKVEQSPAVTIVTWDGVHTFGDPTPSWMQFQFHADGRVRIAFGNVSPNTAWPHLIGYSPAGASADPGPFDFSSLFPSATTFTQFPEAPALALTSTTPPIAGTTWNLQLANVPASTVFGVDIWGLSDPGITDLAALGMPGCQLRASLDVMVLWVHGGGSTHSRAFPVPPLTLLGVDVYTASATFVSLPVNAFGAVISNGIRGTIGSN